jgi:hypothetical protein
MSLYTGNWEVPLDLYPAAICLLLLQRPAHHIGITMSSEVIFYLYFRMIFFFNRHGSVLFSLFTERLEVFHLIWMGIKSQWLQFISFHSPTEVSLDHQKCRGICKFRRSVISVIYFGGFQRIGFSCSFAAIDICFHLLSFFRLMLSLLCQPLLSGVAFQQSGPAIRVIWGDQCTLVLYAGWDLCTTCQCTIGPHAVVCWGSPIGKL